MFCSSFLVSPPSATSAGALTSPAMLGTSAFLCGQQLCLQSNMNPLTARAATMACPTTRRRCPCIEAKAINRRAERAVRHQRIRKKLEGTPERPRMSVFRSNKHLYVQIIDDTQMNTLASASTMQKPMSEEFDYSSGPTIEVAKRLGEIIAKSCLEKGITKVAFDRGGYLYHGRIEVLANTAREHGLQF